MSTASRVPETWELSGDDALQTLRTVGRGALLRDAFMRLRFADGFSHARSMAFATSLVLVQGLITLVGFAALLGDSTLATSVVRTIRSVVSGPARLVLTDAVIHASQTGSSSRVLPLVLGSVGALVTGSTLLGQLERGLNRIYGVEQDRPPLRKYGLALVLTLTAGMCAVVAFVLFAFGREMGRTLGSDARVLWDIARWPIALGFIVVAMGLLFRRSPRRHQPTWSWLAYGAAVAVTLWTLPTLLLGLLLSASTSFGATYGPLAGIVALQIWTLLSAISILYGAAVAAQLEAVRSGEPLIQEREKLDADKPNPEQPVVLAAASAPAPATR